MGIRCRRERSQCWSGHSCSLCRGLSRHAYLLPVEGATGETPTLHPREGDVSRASAAPGEPISEQLCSEGLQHTQGSVLEQGKARGGSCSYPGATTAALSQRPGGAGNEGLEWSRGKGRGGEEFLGVPLLSPSKSSSISNK